MKEGCYFAEKKHGSPNFEIVKHDRIDTTSNTKTQNTKITNPSLIISNFGIWHWDWGTLGNKLSKKYLP